MIKRFGNLVLCATLLSLLLPLGNACSKMEVDPSLIAPSSFSSTGSIAKTNDQLFSLQWNLENLGQLGGASGEDANVVPVWNEGVHGENVVVAVVDDGIEIAHPDLKGNIKAGLSHNYNNNSDDPTSDAAIHGTCVGGVIAAVGNNSAGISGVAPKAQLVGYNFLESNITSNEIDALTRGAQSVSIYNSSWGPAPASQGVFRASTQNFRNAVEDGIHNGRGGKGSIYIFAAGNGAVSENGEPADNSNMNGYANFYGVTAVCAVDDRGGVSVYSEPGANLWVCAPSNSGYAGEPGIATTDMVGALKGYNIMGAKGELVDKNYTKTFGGTSAAAPLVSGVVALMLSARPELSWRDVKMILAKTARKNDSASKGWATNGAGYNIHYDYGFGVVDAKAAVDLAKQWPLITGTLAVAVSNSSLSAIAIPDAGAAVTSPITISATGGIKKIEYVEVTVNLTHQDWGNLTIQLERSGTYTTISRLTVNHKCVNDDGAEVNCTVSGNTFRFGTARHLGEAAEGTWTLRVTDADASDSITGTLNSWQIKIYGEH